jgi:hypothetical protein
MVKRLRNAISGLDKHETAVNLTAASVAVLLVGWMRNRNDH